MNKYTSFHEEPRVSFGSFTFAWEQREFQKLFVERREKTETEFEDTLLSCAINGMFLNSELFGHFRGSTTIGYLKVKKNDLILSAQNLHLGNANVNLRFEHGIISPAYKVYDIIDCDPKFIQSWVKKEDTKNFFLAATTEGASQCRKNIEWNTLNKQNISVPKIDEQKKIGIILEVIDNLITLHQRESELLCSVKHTKINKNKAYFTNVWEQRKLGEVVDVQCGKDYKHLSDGDIPVYGTGGYMLSVNKALSYNQDAIGIGRKGTIDKPYVLKAPFWTVDTLFYAIPKDNNKLDFLNCIFQNVDWKKKDESTGVPSLSKSTINDVDIFIPNENEQQSIGEYFCKLDHLITLHQRELEKLQNIKKSMLEKMFV